MNWEPCNDISGVQAFLETVGTCRVFIKDFAKISHPLNNLLKKDLLFEWGYEQEKAMYNLKDALINCSAIRPLDYTSSALVILRVNTSWKVVINHLEWPWAWYSQPKHELFGLFRALKAAKYWLLGCQNWFIETDAKYIKGMFLNPGVGPNTAIMRCIDYILMYQFMLKHIPGKSFAADGLSRWDPQPGDDEYPLNKGWIDEPEGPLWFEYPGLEQDVLDAQENIPLEFEDFKAEIDMHGGYVVLVDHIRLFMTNLDKDRVQTEHDTSFQVPCDAGVDWEQFGSMTEPLTAVYSMSPMLLPDLALKLDDQVWEAYEEKSHTKTAKSQDDQLEKVKQWLLDPHTQPPDLNSNEFLRFTNQAKQFYLNDDDKLFRQSPDGTLKAIIEKSHQMYIMQAMHDHLGHKESYATKEFISERFWWPELERDVHWYVKTCHICQAWQKTLVWIPPTVTDTPGLFQIIHADVMHMMLASNGCKFIVHGCCALPVGWRIDHYRMRLLDR